MTKIQYQIIKKTTKKAIQEAENEALEEGVDITSVEFRQVLLELKKTIVKEMGFDFNEYNEYKESEETKKTKELKGDKGDSIKGDKGDSITGPKGDKGDKGDTIVGLMGKTGKRGEKGETVVGPRGLHGPQGDRGPDGKVPKIELKKIKNELKDFILKAIPLPRGRVSDKGGRFPNAPDWGIPDKGSYGTAIPDTRYLKREESASSKLEVIDLSSQCDSSTLTFDLGKTVNGVILVRLNDLAPKFTVNTAKTQITLVVAPDSDESLEAIVI